MNTTTTNNKMLLNDSDFVGALQMNNQLEMLSQREQLIEDIDGIVEDWCYSSLSEVNEANMEDLIRVLCDAVCKNFPTN